MEITEELFDEFIIWLKMDGLTPRKSERLWKKTIFSRLRHGHKRTLENWDDFIVDFNQKQRNQTPIQDFDENCLIGIGVNVSGAHKTIRNVVKGETVSRVFFTDGTDMDVENMVLIRILDTHMKGQKC